MSSVAVVSAVSGEASALRGGQSVPLSQGTPLEAGDILFTGDDSSLSVRFNDDSVIDLKEQTRVHVKEFLFEPQEQAFSMHVMEGVLRSVSGKIVEQNPEAFSISSPLGMVGIRGTETQHIISPKFEVHSVLSLGEGHTVFIRTADGRMVIISESLKGVIIALGDETPLQLFDVTKELLEEYLLLLKSQGHLQDDPSGFFVLGDAAFLAELGAMDLTSMLAFLPGENLDALLTGLGGIDERLGPLLVNALSSSSSNTGIYQVFTGSFMSYSGSALNDTLLLNGGGNNTLHAGTGDDLILIAAGDAGSNYVLGGHGSWDHIIVESGGMNSNKLSGDEDIMPYGARGDDDVIEVFGGMDQGAIYGDAHSVTYSASAGPYAYGGNDTIIIHGDMQDTMPGNSSIYGDFQGALYGHPTPGTSTGNFVCGDDYILVDGNMTGGWIYGDTNGSPDFPGNDTIRITGNMTYGVIYGDGATMIGNGGSNALIVDGLVCGTNSSNQAVIYGANGNDTISIGGLGPNSFVAGLDGDDEITVGALVNTLTDSLLLGGGIDGGAGNDTIKLNGYDTVNVMQLSGGRDYGASVDDDLFVFAQPVGGHATVKISDFGSSPGSFHGNDKIDLSAFGSSNVTYDSTDSKLICAGSGGILTIIVVNASGTFDFTQQVVL